MLGSFQQRCVTGFTCRLPGLFLAFRDVPEALKSRLHPPLRLGMSGSAGHFCCMPLSLSRRGRNPLPAMQKATPAARSNRSASNERPSSPATLKAEGTESVEGAASAEATKNMAAVRGTSAGGLGMRAITPSSVCPGGSGHCFPQGRNHQHRPAGLNVSRGIGPCAGIRSLVLVTFGLRNANFVRHGRRSLLQQECTTEPPVTLGWLFISKHVARVNRLPTC